MNYSESPLIANQFTDQERDIIVDLSAKLTGSNLATASKLNSCMVNILRRIEATESKSLRDYLARLEHSTEELGHFISAITIHTTSWFRESPHYEGLRRFAEAFVAKFSGHKGKATLRFLSAGCSTGEEAYTAGLVLEEVRQAHPGFDYVIEGWDIDPVSVAKANQAVFAIHSRTEIPQRWQKYLLVGTGRTTGFFTVDKEIRNRCSFRRRSLTAPKQSSDQPFDLIFCRNVLIYFSVESVNEIVKIMASLLRPEGLLCLGHSESIEAKNFSLEAQGHATYKAPGNRLTELSLVSTQPLPVKTSVPIPKTSKSPLQIRRRPSLIVIGASTGGTEVLIKLLQNMPKPCPPIAVVQHIALAFCKPFAERLAQSAGLTLARPDHGAILLPNHLYMALDDYHIAVKERVDGYALAIVRSDLIHGVRPSVDVLFQSAAKCRNKAPVTAILLTGMGKDGAAGLLELRSTGAMTLVQDEQSSTVFGMPREAILRGAAGFVGDPVQIRQQLNLVLSL